VGNTLVAHIPVDSIPVDSIPVDSIPVDSIPVDNTLVAHIPVGRMPATPPRVVVSGVVATQIALAGEAPWHRGTVAPWHRVVVPVQLICMRGHLLAKDAEGAPWHPGTLDAN
jgi:hypothetical protein